MTHIYNGNAARDMVETILEEYIPAFEELKRKLEELYGEQIKKF